jgi:hypothetical protein
LQNALSTYKAGKSLYGTGKDIYNKYLGGDNSSSPTGQGVNTNQTTNGQTVNDQFSNASSSDPGYSLAGTIGTGVGMGASLAGSAAPAGSVVVEDLAGNALLGGDAATAGTGAAAAGDAAAGASAAGDTAGTGASTLGTVGSYAGPVVGILGMIESALGDEIHGSHSVSGGALLPGQEVKPVGDGGQSQLVSGSLGRGYGNDASQGSGQWFFNGDTKGKDGWLGAGNTTKMDNYMTNLRNVVGSMQSGKATKNADGTYSIPQAGGTVIFNPTDGSMKIPATKMNTPGMSGRNTVKPGYTLSVKDIYDAYGGQGGNDQYGGWGTDFNTWLGNAYGVFSNQSGSQSGSGWLKDGGQVKGYAGGGKVETLIKFLEGLSLNPHATKGYTGHMLEDPVENIKYAANEAKSTGKITPEAHSDLNNLMQKYVSGSPEISDEQMADQLLNLHRGLFGTVDEAPLASGVKLFDPNDVDVKQLVPKAFGVLAKKYGGSIRSS